MLLDEEDGQRLGQVQSLVRAFGILDELAKHDAGCTLTQVAEATSLPRSTAHRLLTTMNALGYVDFNPSINRWMIGLQAFSLGATFVQMRDLGRVGRPIMRSLMFDAGETVNIAIADVENVTCVGQVKPVNVERAMAVPGRHLPMHTTASGKVLLAYREEQARDAFLKSHDLRRCTALTIVEKNALVAQLEQVRANGYAVDDQENELGTRCIAAPVFDRHGRVRASLSISGSIKRIPQDRLPALVQTLAAAAQRMTSDIGGLLAA